jgi:hypothetical protein
LAVAWLAGAVGGWQWTWVVTLSMATMGLLLALRIQQALARKTLAAQPHA